MKQNVNRSARPIAVDSNVSLVAINAIADQDARRDAGVRTLGAFLTLRRLSGYDDRAFVRLVYGSFLGRAPKLWELNRDVARLQRGALGRDQLVAQLWLSAERRPIARWWCRMQLLGGFRLRRLRSRSD